MHTRIYIIAGIFFLSFSLKGIAQKQIVKPDLSSKNNFAVLNRMLTVTNDQKNVVYLDGKPGDGTAWLKDITFKKGVVEFDAKGKNVLQQSFIGIAFHGLNDSTFDALYFRPFNFQSPDTARKAHSVQYVSLPQYDWSVLRQTFPGKYENKLTSSIDPESWFHVKVIVDTKISVYVNKDQQPCLVVKPLNNRTTGNIGFWVGNNSDGYFSNLIIQNN